MKSSLPEGCGPASAVDGLRRGESARSAHMQRLTTLETRLRLTYLAFLPAILLALQIGVLGSLPGWFPLATSCGAMTGLPCIFCGMTRAVHYLLHGEVGKTLYYNWLAFPFVAGAIAIYVVNAIELLLNRSFFARVPPLRLTRSSLGAIAIGFVLLWCFQVYLAVSQHKTELLNPKGPLYSLVVH